MVTRRNFLTSTAVLAANSSVKPLKAQNKPGSSGKEKKSNILIAVAMAPYGPGVEL